MAGSTPPDDDDAALFRDAIGAVRRLQETPLPPRKAPPKPAARMAERDEDDALSEFQRGLAALDPHAAGDVLSYRREALSTRAFHRLKRGQDAHHRLGRIEFGQIQFDDGLRPLLRRRGIRRQHHLLVFRREPDLEIAAVDLQHLIVETAARHHREQRLRPEGGEKLEPLAGRE